MQCSEIKQYNKKITEKIEIINEMRGIYPKTLLFLKPLEFNEFHNIILVQVITSDIFRQELHEIHYTQFILYNDYHA